ncbi:DMT family transporter [Carnimonas nigrificans]|uniref:DMT family transporter n=1 Tax=Carnimonas nigrificans TaxID=64323 RepID=UPI0004722106|nr:DMT family transporter [Carnimonas nigrificans]
MVYLIAVTILWSFSFSLINVYLSSSVDSYFAVMIRILLALVLFLPFLRPRRTPLKTALGLMGVGAIQIGAMSIFVYQAFTLLSVPEVLLFTVLTPLYVTLFDDALARRFSGFHLATAAIAVTGALLIASFDVKPGFWNGFVVVQLSNLCFAVGQVAYRRLPGLADSRHGHKGALQQFGWFYVGAAVLLVPAWLLLGDWTRLPTTSVQWGVLAWLGLIASGLGYYFWNEGARRVDAGTLAIMNEALKPAGLAVNVLIWNHDTDPWRLALCSVVICGALALNLWGGRRRRTA